MFQKQEVLGEVGGPVDLDRLGVGGVGGAVVQAGG